MAGRDDALPPVNAASPQPLPDPHHLSAASSLPPPPCSRRARIPRAHAARTRLALRLPKLRALSVSAVDRYWRARSVIREDSEDGSSYEYEQSIVENFKDGYAFADGPPQPRINLPLVAFCESDVGAYVDIRGDMVTLRRLPQRESAVGGMRLARPAGPRHTTDSGSVDRGSPRRVRIGVGAEALPSASADAGSVETRRVVWPRRGGAWSRYVTAAPSQASRGRAPARAYDVTNAYVAAVLQRGTHAEVELVEPADGAPGRAITRVIPNPWQYDVASPHWHPQPEEDTWWLRFELLNFTNRDRDREHQQRQQREREERMERIERELQLSAERAEEEEDFWERAPHPLFLPTV